MDQIKKPLIAISGFLCYKFVMNSKKIYLALIGAGGIAHKWVKAIAKTKKCALKLVMDVDLNKAGLLAENCKNCNATSKFENVLSRSDIDAVIIAVPNKFSAKISRESLRAGKHVLCEKPGAVNSREVKSVIATAEKHKGVYMVGFNHRFHSAFLQAKKFFDKGEIGQPLFVSARYGFGGRAGYNKEWRFNKKISGGGEVIDQGVHMIDLARLFLGEFSEVKAYTPNLFWGGKIEDNGFILLKTPRSQVASIHVSWTNWKWIHSFEIMGTQGYLRIDGLDQRYNGPERLTLGRRDPVFKKPPQEKTVIFKKEQAEDSFARQLREFLSAITEKRRPVPSGYDAYEVLKVIDEIYGKK